MPKQVLFDTPEFREMWSNNVPAREIAAVFGVTPTAVWSQAKLFNYPTRNLKNVQEARLQDTPEFRRLWKSGASLIDIGAHFGVSGPTVRKWALRYDYPVRSQPVKRLKNTEEFLTMWNSGVSQADIAAHFGVAQSSVGHAARRFNYPERAPAWSKKAKPRAQKATPEPTPAPAPAPSKPAPRRVALPVQPRAQQRPTLPPPAPHPNWSAAQDAKVLQCQTHQDRASLARQLGRTQQAVTARWHVLRAA